MAKKKAAKRTAKPKDVNLPGVERVPKPISDICGTISDARAQVNDGQAVIKAQVPTAIRLMKQYGMKAVTEHGVRLTLNEGHDTLSIKQVAEAKGEKK